MHVPVGEHAGEEAGDEPGERGVEAPDAQADEDEAARHLVFCAVYVVLVGLSVTGRWMALSLAFWHHLPFLPNLCTCNIQHTSHLAHRQPVLACEESGEEGLAGGAEGVTEGGEEEEAAQHYLMRCVYFDALGCVVCGCGSSNQTKQPKKIPNHKHTYTHRHYPPTCERDGPRELRGDAQGGVADGLAEERKEDGPRKGEELGCVVLILVVCGWVWWGGGGGGLLCCLSVCGRGGGRTRTYVRGHCHDDNQSTNDNTT